MKTLSARSWTLTLVLLLSAFPVAAQTIGGGNAATACSAMANANTLRAEGYTELLGDIVVVCTGTPTTATFNLTVFLNGPVTSRLLSTSGSSGQPSEALLLINDPAPGAQVPCTTGGGGTPAMVGAGPGGCPFSSNVFQGVASGNQVTFFGIPALPAVTGGMGMWTYRITNVRVNANVVGGQSLSGTSSVIAILSTSGVALPIQNAAALTVAYVQRGVDFQVRTADNTQYLNNPAFNPCAAGNICPFATLRFQENFASATKPQVSPLSPSAQNQPGVAPPI
jgi:hypothetical protein